MTSPLTYALRDASEDTEEVTAEHSPEPALIARSRMKSVSSMPHGSESGLRAVTDPRSTSMLPPPRFIEDYEEQLPTEPYASAALLHSPHHMPVYEEPKIGAHLNSPSSLPPPRYLDDYDDEPTLAHQSPASSLPPPKYSMRVPSGTYGYSDVAVRSANEPRPESLGPPALPSTPPMQSVDMGVLQMSALRLLLARLTEDAGPAARPMMLVEIQALGARPEMFPRILASDLLARLGERLDVPETRRSFIIDGRRILDRELYVQHARG